MKYKFALIALSIIGFASCNNNMEESKINYPETYKGDVVDTYFGTEVADPYRWLEDDRSAETKDWVIAENEVTNNYLSKIPFRDKIYNRLEKLWNYEKVSSPSVHGDYIYFYKNDGLQSQFVVYRKDASGKEEVFLDPNTFSKEGTTSLGGIEFSKDGSLVAYSISEGGSDWRKVIVLDVESKKQIEDTLVDVKFSGVSWYKNEGFYYSSYDKPKGSELSAKTDQHKLYFHKLGTSQSSDLVVFGDVIKRRYVGGGVTEDQKYLIISAANSTSGNELYIKDLENPISEIITIVEGFETTNNVFYSENNSLFISTNLKAPNMRVVKISVSNPQPSNWVDFIPETKNVLNISTGSGYFFANYMKDALSQVIQYDLEGNKVREIELPGLGTASGFSGEVKDKVLYFSFTNYITPGASYTFNPITGETKEYIKPVVDFKSLDFESKQVFYTSKDGTKVPMIITYKKGIKLDGTNPTLLYAYGGFNISITPSFSIARAVWLEQGGVLAVANLRGGGEYGRAWHDAGIKTKKQNVFDDFIAAAEYLISEKYTSSNFLAIQGGSNGGLLVGATMTQSPDLIRVALPAVGVMDMLRYHTFTAGAGWAYDYGTSEESKEMFEYL
ncbi:MAG: S9 family peptidase, partial [Flavobacteriales bacterium]|nr:S9 family peptidase [Flavobacteriales bacterium]